MVFKLYCCWVLTIIIWNRLHHKRNTLNLLQSCTKNNQHDQNKSIVHIKHMQIPLEQSLKEARKNNHRHHHRHRSAVSYAFSELNTQKFNAEEKNKLVIIAIKYLSKFEYVCLGACVLLLL